jgi:hypothetical protein
MSAIIINISYILSDQGLLMANFGAVFGDFLNMGELL